MKNFLKICIFPQEFKVWCFHYSSNLIYVETFWRHEFIEEFWHFTTRKKGGILGVLRARLSAPDWLVGSVRKILAEDHMYYNHYAIEFAFKKAMSLDTMAVVHFAISACK